MGEVSVGMNLRIPYLDWNLVWVYSLAVWYVFCNSNFCTSFTRWCFWISRCFPKIYASNSKRVMLWCCKNMQKLEHGLKHEQNPQSGILGFFLVVIFYGFSRCVNHHEKPPFGRRLLVQFFQASKSRKFKKTNMFSENWWLVQMIHFLFLNGPGTFP